MSQEAAPQQTLWGLSTSHHCAVHEQLPQTQCPTDSVSALKTFCVHVFKHRQRSVQVLVSVLIWRHHLVF